MDFELPLAMSDAHNKVIISTNYISVKYHIEVGRFEKKNDSKISYYDFGCSIGFRISITITE